MNIASVLNYAANIQQLCERVCDGTKYKSALAFLQIKLLYYASFFPVKP